MGPASALHRPSPTLPAASPTCAARPSSRRRAAGSSISRPPVPAEGDAMNAPVDTRRLSTVAIAAGRYDTHIVRNQAAQAAGFNAFDGDVVLGARSEERRVGKGCGGG